MCTSSAGAARFIGYMNETKLPLLPSHIVFDGFSEWDKVIDVIDTKTGKAVSGVYEVNVRKGWIKVFNRSLEPPKRVYDCPPYLVTITGDYELVWNEHGISLINEMDMESVSPDLPCLTREVVEWLLGSIDDHSWNRADARMKLAIHALEKHFKIENAMR